VNNTPLQIHYVNGVQVFVKREDLCIDPPAPPFSKVRGVYKHLKTLKQEGVKVVGYTETSISMAGWAVAWASYELGMKAVIFNPIYKATHPVLEYHREQWKKFNAEIIDIPAGMAKVNWYISKRLLFHNYGEAVLLPLGLPFTETIEETKEQTKTVYLEKGSLVISVGSGTICAGICGGYHKGVTIYGVMTRSGNVERKTLKIFPPSLFNGKDRPTLKLVDPGYEYTDSVDIETPFPCNKYYDAKAWKFLVENIDLLEKPIIFWNIGANSDGT
jgi:1-aminocyclopropane-1-carboxylate deaminase/D-cysteine desulfhydrase-like pyridoxal-dependent ACC family enzyme